MKTVFPPSPFFFSHQWKYCSPPSLSLPLILEVCLPPWGCHPEDPPTLSLNSTWAGMPHLSVSPTGEGGENEDHLQTSNPSAKETQLLILSAEMFHFHFYRQSLRQSSSGSLSSGKDRRKKRWGRGEFGPCKMSVENESWRPAEGGFRGETHLARKKEKDWAKKENTSPKGKAVLGKIKRRMLEKCPDYET